MKSSSEIKKEILAAVEDINANSLSFTEIEEKYGHLIQYVIWLETRYPHLIPDGQPSFEKIIKFGIDLEKNMMTVARGIDR